MRTSFAGRGMLVENPRQEHWHLALDAILDISFIFRSYQTMGQYLRLERRLLGANQVHSSPCHGVVCGMRGDLHTCYPAKKFHRDARGQEGVEGVHVPYLYQDGVRQVRVQPGY